MEVVDGAAWEVVDEAVFVVITENVPEVVVLFVPLVDAVEVGITGPGAKPVETGSVVLAPLTEGIVSTVEPPSSVFLKE